MSQKLVESEGKAHVRVRREVFGFLTKENDANNMKAEEGTRSLS